MSGLVFYLTAATVYLLVLAVVYFIVPEPQVYHYSKLNRFGILVPAHNEELLILRLCESLQQIAYSQELFEVFIIADNCTDRTAEICGAYPFHVLTRNDPSHRGKGFAISWALERISLEKFDAVFMVDADNTVDPMILTELNQAINRGELAIQCNNSVGNRADSWFTQLLFVSRTVSNLLYHHSKYKLGLSSYLMGNGLCFNASLLLTKGWTAFSAGEDWEYYARLINEGVKIGFAVKARVFHQESKSLDQATSQRLRWSSGRFKVARGLGVRLFLRGLRDWDWFTLDASLPLVFPNYSLQINLTVFAIILGIFLPASAVRTLFIALCLFLLSGQLILFLTGAYIAGGYWETFKAMIRAPLFLVWKSIIDIFSLTGLYRGDKWVRTSRHRSADEATPPPEKPGGPA